MQRTLLLLWACWFVTGCPAPETIDPDAGAGASPPDAAPCAEPASVYGVNVHDEAELLSEGSNLPVTLGFQGFQYIRIGIRTPRALPSTVELSIRVAVEGTPERDTAFYGVETRDASGGEMESADVSVMFNDVSLVDLLGHRASLHVITASAGCALDGAAEVILVQGVYQGPDGGTTLPDGG